MDTSDPALSAVLNYKPDLIKPNLREFEELTQPKLDSEALRIEAVKRIRGQMDIGMIALTLGAGGCTARHRKRSLAGNGTEN